MSAVDSDSVDWALRANTAVEELWKGHSAPESVHAKRWMLFVDGENTAIRAREYLKAYWKVEIAPEHRLHSRDIYIWPHRLVPGNVAYYYLPSLLRSQAERCFLFTSVVGSDERINDIRERLHALGFQPRVFKKPATQKQEKAKGVDIALATTMLSNAYLDNYDVAVLMTEDADYIPVVEEVKHSGKQVFLIAMRTERVNRELILACDHVRTNWDAFLAAEWSTGLLPGPDALTNSQ